VTLVGFVGADPEQRQANGSGAKFTVLSVATQRSWKNADDEWASKTKWHRVCIFRPRLAEHVATAITKGAHVLVEGELVSSTYERPNGKSKKSATIKITSWSVRADVVRKLDRDEPQPEVNASGTASSNEDWSHEESTSYTKCDEVLPIATSLSSAGRYPIEVYSWYQLVGLGGGHRTGHSKLRGILREK
jgi:single-strand DNA-binding protein